MNVLSPSLRFGTKTGKGWARNFQRSRTVTTTTAAEYGPCSLLPSQKNARYAVRIPNWSAGVRFSSSFSGQRPDPLARRPNKVCDPYGQGGKPLSLENAQRLIETTALEDGWKLETKSEQDALPESLYREFYHFDYLRGAKFVSQMAAVAHNNNHYPSISLERRLHKKGAWQVTTTVKCRTSTLQGLSHHDFHVAAMVDIEIGRPQVAELLLSDEDSQRKHT